MTTATNCYIRQHQLTVQQENAIDLLIAGKLDGEVADAVGVHRVTVTRWRNYHPVFQAELNSRRRELWGAATQRLRAMLPAALEAIEQEIADGNNRLRAAVHVVKLAGLDTFEGPSERTEPDHIIENLVAKRFAERTREREEYQTLNEQLEKLADPSVRKQRDERLMDEVRQEVLREIESRLTTEDSETGR